MGARVGMKDYVRMGVDMVMGMDMKIDLCVRMGCYEAFCKGADVK